jgi:hypothetical protein
LINRLWHLEFGTFFFQGFNIILTDLWILVPVFDRVPTPLLVHVEPNLVPRSANQISREAPEKGKDPERLLGDAEMGVIPIVGAGCRGDDTAFTVILPLDQMTVAALPWADTRLSRPGDQVPLPRKQINAGPPGWKCALEYRPGGYWAMKPMKQSPASLHAKLR